MSPRNFGLETSNSPTHAPHFTIYTAPLERSMFPDNRPNWLEGLGDLARYRIAIAA
jgi:hypothetical protein